MVDMLIQIASPDISVGDQCSVITNESEKTVSFQVHVKRRKLYMIVLF